MNRKEFLKYGLLGGIGMMNISTFAKCAAEWEEQDTRMPALFIGHGSPMNALEDNIFSQEWKKQAAQLPKPTAILCISAHWLTNKTTMITAMPKPKTIHDFGGFPDELFQVQYPAKGLPDLAKEISETIDFTQIALDHEWGLDHGTWSVLKQMYPKADIPVLQLSIAYDQPMQFHYDLAKHLNMLRKKGVLIIGSGNMVHNLRLAMQAMRQNPDNMDYAFDWATEINTKFKELITDKNHSALINYQKLGKAAQLAIPTTDHYIPLIYTLALQNKNEKTTFFNDHAFAGALTMTSVLIQ